MSDAFDKVIGPVGRGEPGRNRRSGPSPERGTIDEWQSSPRGCLACSQVGVFSIASQARWKQSSTRCQSRSETEPLSRPDWATGVVAAWSYGGMFWGSDVRGMVETGKSRSRRFAA